MSVVLGLSPGLITISMLFQKRKEMQKNVFVSLFIYCVFPFVGVFLALFFYGFSWINFGYGFGALHLFYSSLKLLEIEFYSDKSDGAPPRLAPSYKQVVPVPEKKKRIASSHLWQAVCSVSAGILSILIIISITGVDVPEKKVVVEKPYMQNDVSEDVCVTFLRDPEKVWRDGNDYSRVGAQYNGVLFNNMKATVITNWRISVEVPEEGCSIDPNPWNGSFSFSKGQLKIRKPQDGDQENIHGADFYKVSPGKTINFGCIMYAPGRFSPLKGTSKNFSFSR